ncbi:hypothetical protein ABI59_16315 [Acidobacteria bacterium Mor1]|nr:hypothetical protein ABI59_16315 [Acidobacteria bacterium Mor1]
MTDQKNQNNPTPGRLNPFAQQDSTSLAERFGDDACMPGPRPEVRRREVGLIMEHPGPMPGRGGNAGLS